MSETKLPAGQIPHCPFARPSFYDLMLAGRIVDHEGSVVACTYGPGRCGGLVFRCGFKDVPGQDELEPKLELWLSYRKPSGHTIAAMVTGTNTTSVAVKLYFAIGGRLAEFHLSPMPQSSKEKEE